MHKKSKIFSVPGKLGLKVMPGLVLCMADEFFPVRRDLWLCPIAKI